MILLSAVVFCSFIIVLSDSRLDIGILVLDGGLALGVKCEGSDEADVLAGTLRSPSGSLRVDFEMRSTEPIEDIRYQPLIT